MNRNRSKTIFFKDLINRRTFLKTMGIYVAGGLLSSVKCTVDSTKKRPLNFIVILVDDLGWTDLSCYGSQYYETPNIDRLASQGVQFSNAYAACAVCSPTRAAVLTGRYPARVGVTDWIRANFQRGGKPAPEQKLPEYVGTSSQELLCPRNPFWMETDEITLAEALKPAVYVSCHVGKWHLGMEDWYPEKQGFDFNIGGCDFGQPPSYFDPYYREKQGYIPTLKPRKEGEYLTDRENDEAVNFIRENRDSSFFLYMAHYAVHTPIQAKNDLIARYKAKKPTNHNNPVYAAMVHSVDEAVGRIMSTLDELNLTNNTVIIFTSDNGGLIGPTNNTPLRAGKGYPYEGGIRVPLIIRWHGVVEPGSVCDESVTSVDYFPTIMEAAGVKIPSGLTIDGENLLPVLTQTGSLKRDAIYWHFPHYRQRDIVPYSIIRAGDWKLIKRYEGKTFELFKLDDDLGEKNDLSKQIPEKVRELDARLTTWLKETGAKLPKKNPDYKPK